MKGKAKGKEWEKTHNVSFLCADCATALRSHKLTPEEIAMIVPGAAVKVNHLNEGFWVLVTEVDGDTIRGTVDNDLLLDHGFNYGDTLELTVSEVYQVIGKGSMIEKQ